MKISEFLSGNFLILVVKFSIYFNRRVFVMDTFFFRYMSILCIVPAHVCMHCRQRVPMLIIVWLIYGMV